MSSDQNILVKLKDAGFQINDKWLVKGVSLQVEKGKIVTLIGPNGSGKSTTAKIALGIYKKIIKHLIFLYFTFTCMNVIMPMFIS